MRVFFDQRYPKLEEQSDTTVSGPSLPEHEIFRPDVTGHKEHLARVGPVKGVPALAGPVRLFYQPNPRIKDYVWALPIRLR